MCRFKTVCVLIFEKRMTSEIVFLLLKNKKRKTKQTNSKTQRKLVALSVPYPPVTPLLLARHSKIGCPRVPRVCRAAVPPLAAARFGRRRARTASSHTRTTSLSGRRSVAPRLGDVPGLFLAGCRADLRRPPGVAPHRRCGLVYAKQVPQPIPSGHAN